MFRINLPPVVKHILILNIILFAGTWLLQGRDINLTRVFGLYSFQADDFRPYQLVTHMFMHGGLFHLFFNMFGLVMFGRVLEMVLGSKKMFILYFVAGFGAAFLHLLINYLQMEQLLALAGDFATNSTAEAYGQILDKYMVITQPDFVYTANAIKDKLFYGASDSELLANANVVVNTIVRVNLSIPMVGASGAVFGILAAFALMFPNVELMLIFLPVPIKAKYFIPVYAVLELFMGVANFKGDNIAHFAHLGGAIFGFLIAWYWKKNQFKIL